MTATRRTSTGMAGERGRNRVRIIAGKWRSRIVKFPPAAQLRPTPDRVRETLFNWLGQRLDGLSCLDLFAGSGALGFEALSRGARRVVMVERDRTVAAALRDSARTLEALDAEVVEAESLQYLRRTGEKFDVAFIDPPFATPLALESMALLPARLNEGARVYVESAEPIPAVAPWRALRQDRAGAVRYALFELAQP
jgi:16S rRNA (guanine966-N2)-methyltransferase